MGDPPERQSAAEFPVGDDAAAVEGAVVRFPFEPSARQVRRCSRSAGSIAAELLNEPVRKLDVERKLDQFPIIEHETFVR